MDILQLIAIALGQVAVIARDPALGPKGEAITEALALLATLVARGDAARVELEALTLEVQQMAEAKTPPTKDQWLSFRDMSRRYHEILNPPVSGGPVG